MGPAHTQCTVAWVTLLFISTLTRLYGADPLEAQVALTQGYATFDEAVTQLETAIGLKIACPADTASTMRGVWNKGRFPSWAQEEFVKARRPAKELLTTVCADLGLAWKISPTNQTVLIDVPWRTPDSRSAADLLQAIWKPGQESEFAKDEEWWRALDGLLSKEENFALSCRTRQRANLESLLRKWLTERTMSAPSQTITEASVVSTSGERYQCLFIVRAMQVSPGHGWMSYYCFDDRGTLKIADVINTGHRQIVDQLAVYPRGRDGTEASEVQMVIRHNNNGTPRSLSFALQDHGLKLVDDSGAGETLLGSAE